MRNFCIIFSAISIHYWQCSHLTHLLPSSVSLSQSTVAEETEESQLEAAIRASLEDHHNQNSDPDLIFLEDSEEDEEEDEEECMSFSTPLGSDVESESSCIDLTACSGSCVPPSGSNASCAVPLSSDVLHRGSRGFAGGSTCDKDGRSLLSECVAPNAASGSRGHRRGSGGGGGLGALQGCEAVSGSLSVTENGRTLGVKRCHSPDRDSAMLKGLPAKVRRSSGEIRCGTANTVPASTPGVVHSRQTGSIGATFAQHGKNARAGVAEDSTDSTAPASSSSNGQLTGTTEDVSTILVRFPDGSRRSRAFPCSHPIKVNSGTSIAVYDMCMHVIHMYMYIVCTRVHTYWYMYIHVDALMVYIRPSVRALLYTWKFSWWFLNFSQVVLHS